MRTIELTQGQVAVIDDHHFSWVSKHKWCVNRDAIGDFYAVRNSPRILGKKTSILMHRKIMEHLLGRLLTNDEEVDHINLDKLCNLDTNLRLASSSENKCNREKQSNNTSGYKGVHWDSQRGKWRSTLNIQGKKISVGHFIDIEDAARAYDKAAIKYHGRFARTNFPIEDYDAK